MNNPYYTLSQWKSAQIRAAWGRLFAPRCWSAPAVGHPRFYVKDWLVVINIKVAPPVVVVTTCCIMHWGGGYSLSLSLHAFVHLQLASKPSSNWASIHANFSLPWLCYTKKKNFKKTHEKATTIYKSHTHTSPFLESLKIEGRWPLYYHLVEKCFVNWSSVKF